MIFSSRCTIKRLADRLYPNPLGPELTALPQTAPIAGFRECDTRIGKGREEKERRRKEGKAWRKEGKGKEPHFCKQIAAAGR